MANQTLYRIAGISAVLSILFSFGMFALVGNGRDAVFLGVSMITYITSCIVFYALYVFHRAQAALPALAMLLCGVVGIILEGIGTGPGTILSAVSNLLYAIAFLLIGYLGGTNAQMPRWIAALAFIIGAGAAAAGIGMALGQASIGETLGMVYFFAWVIWSIAICWWFWTRKSVTVTA